MKKKKVFRAFVFFVIALFFLSIPGVYISYFFIWLKENNKQERQYVNKHINNSLSWEDEEEFFSQIEKEVQSLLSGQQSSWLNLSGNNLSWYKK